MRVLLATLLGWLLVSPAMAQGTFPGLDARFFGDSSNPNGGKVFVGDAVKNPNILTASGSGPYGATCSSGDWFANFEATTVYLSCGYWTVFALVVESKTTTSSFGTPNGDFNPSSGILGAGQTLNNNFGGAIGVAGFGIGNNVNAATTGPAGAGGAWGGYFECDMIVNATHAGCYGVEIEAGNFVSNAYSTNGVSGGPDPFQQAKVNGVQLGCGSGGAFVTSFLCAAAAQVVTTGNLFRVGFNILNGSIASQTIFGGTVSLAMTMPLGYGIAWYSAANTVGGGFFFDGSGNFVMVDSGMKINGSTAASCTVSPPANLTVVNGIVTLCN